MKKLSLSLLYIASFAAIATFTTSCGGDDEPVTPTVVDEDSCATAVYPENTGDATTEVSNFEITSIIDVEAGSELALAVEVTKGSNRAKRFKLYQSTCENLLGDEVDVSDQPKGNNNGIDLRRTDEVQLRDVVYTVPSSGFSDIYLTIAVEEAGDLFTYTQLHLEVTGSGIVDEFEGKILGGNSSALGSRLNASTGVVYTECDFADNVESVDITYAIKPSGDYNSYLCSNPARFVDPIGITKTVTSSTTCDSTGVAFSVRGGNSTYFAATTVDFDSATNTELEGLAVSTSDNEYIEVTAEGNVFAFMTTDGQKGLVKVTGVGEGNTEDAGLNHTGGDVTLAFKIQR